jgi:hypothetical protein
MVKEEFPGLDVSTLHREVPDEEHLLVATMGESKSPVSWPGLLDVAPTEFDVHECVEHG